MFSVPGWMYNVGGLRFHDEGFRFQVPCVTPFNWYELIR